VNLRRGKKPSNHQHGEAAESVWGAKEKLAEKINAKNVADQSIWVEEEKTFT